MARQLRIEFPGACYYVTSRGNERKTIFRGKRDRERFLSYLQTAFQRYGAVIHAFCLLDNHYHILIETPSGNLSRIMQHINGAYTSYFNTKHRRSGHLFHGRFKSILVEMDKYANEVSVHIHLNPVRTGLVETPTEYEWSSFKYYTEIKNAPEWLSRNFILSRFGKKLSVAQRQYKKFISLQSDPRRSSPMDDITHSVILGSDDFVIEIKNKFLGVKKIDRDVPALKGFINRPGILEISEATDSIIEKDFKLARQVKLYLCHKYSGMTLKKIGAHFHISESGVSQTSRRISAKVTEDKILEKRITRIKKKLDL